MRFLAFITALILAAPAYAEFRDTTKPMTVQTQLDVNRYLGKWYEIARYPNRFERDCVGVTAEYSLRNNGKINVVNTCFKEVLGGRKKTAKGRAKVKGPGKLSVTFTPFLPFIRGDYWVIHLDEDYQMAVVGEPDGRFGWILSRVKKPSTAQLDAAKAALVENGYRLDALFMVRQ